MKICVLLVHLQIIFINGRIGVEAAPELHDRSRINLPLRRDSEVAHLHEDVENLKDMNVEDAPVRSYKLPKINSMGTQAFDIAPKHSAEDDEPVALQAKFKKRRSPFGIVYNEGKPIGILEPIPQMFEFQNYQNDALDTAVKKRDNNMLKEENKDFKRGEGVRNDLEPMEKFASMNNPNKGSRLLEKDLEKREVTKTDVDDEKLATIENNLKEIMDDLGLINDDDAKKFHEKRSILFEDEDLENGSNKIHIAKEIHPFKINSDASLTKDAKSSETLINDANLEGDSLSKAHGKIADFRGEGEMYIRKKRQQAQNNSKIDGADIVKGLESSGDLTVSGNKSPLASASAPVEAESKHKPLRTRNIQKRDHLAQESDDMDNEKRIQNHIQSTISEIKDEVKREIDSLKSKNQKSKKDDKRDSKTTKRLKRTLADQETNKLSLQNDMNLDSDAREPHIRFRREVPRQSTNFKESDVNKRAEFQNDKEFLHNPKGYEFERGDSRAKRSSNEPQPIQSLSHFQKAPNAAPNLALSHAIAPRDSASSRDVSSAVASSQQDTLNSHKLEKLVSESASLSESVKSERGAKLNEPHVEVELHSNNKESIQKKGANGGDSALSQKRQDFDESNDKEVGATNKRSSKEGQKHLAETNKGETEEKNNDGPMEKNVAKLTHEAVNSAESSINLEPKSVEIRTDNPELMANLVDVASNKDLNELTSDDNLKSSLVEEVLDKRSAHEDASVVDGGSVGMKGAGPSSEMHFEEVKSKIRQERKSEPSLSLEDMQELDSENTSKRKRRFARYPSYSSLRRKRDGEVHDTNFMRFRNYRSDEDEADDESDEFDDDNFDDRTANFVQKRAAGQILQNQNYAEYDNIEPYAMATNHAKKRNAKLNKLVSELNDGDVYDTPNYLYGNSPYNRKKRQVIDDLVALHSGGPVTRHLAAIRERKAFLDSGNSNSNKEMVSTIKKQKQDEGISNLSETDLFGGLPQSYEGELTRLKRVKRDG